MFRFIVWIICIYILAKIIGVVLQFVRPFFETPRKPQPTDPGERNKTAV